MLPSGPIHVRSSRSSARRGTLPQHEHFDFQITSGDWQSSNIEFHVTYRSVGMSCFLFYCMCVSIDELRMYTSCVSVCLLKANELHAKSQYQCMHLNSVPSGL